MGKLTNQNTGQSRYHANKASAGEVKTSSAANRGARRLERPTASATGVAKTTGRLRDRELEEASEFPKDRPAA